MYKVIIAIDSGGRWRCVAPVWVKLQPVIHLLIRFNPHVLYIGSDG